MFDMGKAEDYLEQIPMWTKKKNTLEDVARFLDVLGGPERERPAIHVAGTNGKGSVCAFLTSMLNEAGIRTGTFISPHLVDVKERFLIDGKMVDQESFESGFNAVLKASREMEGQGFFPPSYFEFLFYMAMVIFREKDVDVMILETGMGGRLDVTNVLERPSACVITSISMDHTKYLGDTLEKIAGEKAGIIKEGVPLIFDDGQPRVSTVLEGFAFRKGAPRYPVNRRDDQVEEVDGRGLTVSGRMKDGRRIRLEIPFEAFYQAENAMLAVRTLDVLRSLGRIRDVRFGDFPRPSGIREAADSCWEVTDRQIADGIRHTMWPGRMEQARPGIYLDGAHNPGGISAFMQTAEEITGRLGRKPWLLFAAVSDKDYKDMIGQLCKGLCWEGIGVVHIHSDRGIKAGELARVFEEASSCPVEAYEDTGKAMEEMIPKSRDGILFCVGSLYMIGEIKAVLGRIGEEDT